MNKSLSKYIGIIDRSVLLNALGGYKNFNDKVSRLVEKGELVRLKRGLFITADSMARGELSEFQIANKMYGPSYVSFFTALSHHGLIPERVIAVESATILRSKSISLDITHFTYQQMPVDSFHIGIRREENQSISYLIASPTKALIDVLWSEKMTNVSSQKSLLLYLTLDLRMEEEAIGLLDIDEILECQRAGRRKRLIKALLSIVNEFKS